jgi:hypothetical protein
MLFLWANLTEPDVEAYAGTLVLPPYLSHLRLAPLRLAGLPPTANGREPLWLTYVGEGRIEEHRLEPQEHALPLIRSVCPGAIAARVRLPDDDALWRWTVQGQTPQLRIYFSPSKPQLGQEAARPWGQESYVSVSRGHAFIERPVVEAYLAAWLKRLGLDAEGLAWTFPNASRDVEFAAEHFGGQWTLDDDSAADMIVFSGLGRMLAEVSPFVRIAMGAAGANAGVCEGGVYMPLGKAEDS